MRARSTADWKRTEKRIRAELPAFVRKSVEKEFQNKHDDVLNSLSDIIREGLAYIFTGSVAGTPKTTAGSRVGTPKAMTPPHFDFDLWSDPTMNNIDLERLLDMTDYSGARVSDSGYASTSTGKHTRP